MAFLKTTASNDVFGAAASAPTGRRPFSAQPSREDLPKSQIWLNIGYMSPSGEFISLPFGLPIDTMNSHVIRGSNEEWIAKASAGNEFLEQMKHFGASLEPGESRYIHADGGLVIEIRRAKEEVVRNAANNPHRVDFAAMFKQAAE